MIMMTSFQFLNPFCRVNTLKRQFKHLYVVVTVPTSVQNEAFNHSYFKYVPITMLNAKTFIVEKTY
jgi:hypothetical protein